MLKHVVMLVTVMLASASGQSNAQDYQRESARAPRFLAASGPSKALVRLDADRTPMLRRRISVSLLDATVEDALKTIAREGGLNIAYSGTVLRLDRVVRLDARDITVAAALTEVLLGANADVVFSETGRAMIVKREDVAQRLAGVITGRVTDSTGGQGVAAATVMVEGTRLSVTTGADGSYSLRSVPAGMHTISARRLGYSRKSRSVTVDDGATISADFVLSRAPTSLSDVITTATGDQRRVELGHTITRIVADSVVRSAPVNSVTELLTARAAGLLVTNNDGQVGGNTQIRMRAPNTVNGLDAAPVVIVDGVRFTTTRTRVSLTDRPEAQGLWGVQPTSRLNDLNINDIETVEVVKGAAAATLYGADAANGVLVITTKRGKPGETKWRAHSKFTMSEIPVAKFPDLYWGWSTVDGETSTSSCGLLGVADGSCVQDSVTNIGNDLNNEKYTIFHSQPNYQFGTSVSGGRPELRYYVSADIDDATGPIRLPVAYEEAVRARRGSELPDELQNPNHLFKVNTRSNITAQLGKRGEVSLNTSYLQSATRTIAVEQGVYDLGSTVASPVDNVDGYNSFAAPDQAFAQTVTEYVKRITLGTNGHYRVAPWLMVRATAGMDITNATSKGLLRRGDAPTNNFGAFPNGRVAEDRSDISNYTLSGNATANGRLGRLSSRTTVGSEYRRNLTQGLSGTRSNLLPEGESFSQATGAPSAAQKYIELVSLGSFFEEMIGLNDRLFLTGALRGDGSSTFGQDYHVDVNPKASASWLISQEPFFPRIPVLSELRLRYAVGSATIQPYPTMARPNVILQDGFAEGATRTGITQQDLPNPNLKPERSREQEFGFDANAWNSRVSLEGTWYRRRTEDGLFQNIIPASVSPFFRYWTNVGLVTANGFEAQLNAQVLTSRALSWDVSLQHSYYTNKLVKSGTNQNTLPIQTGQAVGYPLGSVFNRPILSYADANNNHIIEPDEIVFGDTVFVGVSIPPRTQVLSSTLGLFNRRVRLSAAIDRRSGHVVTNSTKQSLCVSARCLDALDRNTPFADQAAAVATGLDGTLSQFNYWEKGDITRFREMSVALDIPSRLLRFARIEDATLTLQGRNLGILSKASDATDPESVTVINQSPVYPFSANGIPQARTWTLRFDLGF
jgi:TonB-linked SusC/RagA family outer membrane protein